MALVFFTDFNATADTTLAFVFSCFDYIPSTWASTLRTERHSLTQSAYITGWLFLGQLGVYSCVIVPAKDTIHVYFICHVRRSVIQEATHCKALFIFSMVLVEPAFASLFQCGSNALLTSCSTHHRVESKRPKSAQQG